MPSIHRFKGDQSEGIYTWDDVQPVEFNTEEIRGVLKHVLVGPEDGAPNFIIRYFQVPINSQTFHHAHPHEHGMLILHGKAKVQINEAFHEVGPLDSIFLSGNDVHQVINTGDSPLGFLCVITREAEQS